MVYVQMVLFGFILFSAIYFSIRLGIKPIVSKKDLNNCGRRSDDINLYDLKHIGIIDSKEFEELTKFFENQEMNRENIQAFYKYSKFLSDLKMFGYLDNEAYKEKVDKLLEYYR